MGNPPLSIALGLQNWKNWMEGQGLETLWAISSWTKTAQQPLRKPWSILNLLGISKMISSRGRMKTDCRKQA